MSDSGFDLSGLYPITSEALVKSESLLLAAVAEALEGGAALIQYRDKLNDPATRHRLATLLQALCARHGRPLIINDDLALAQAVSAAGVHLGRSDGSAAQARTRLGPRAIIGISCQADLDRAVEAEAQGASYVAVGRLFASGTKPEASAASLADLRAICAAVRLPVCAIGGVRAEHVAPLMEAGAGLIAAVEGVFAGYQQPGAVRQAAAGYVSEIPPRFRRRAG